MTSFAIYKNRRGLFSFRYCLNTRLTPIMLFGIETTGWDGCLKDIKQVQKLISFPHSISFTRSCRGYGFTIIANSGHVLAYSRYFSTRKLMMRMLSIVKSHIPFATVQSDIKLKRRVLQEI